MTQEEVRRLLGWSEPKPSPLEKKSEGKYGKRHKRGVMNKTEAAYANILEIRKLAGEIIEWAFEKDRFILAKRTTYTPDFRITHKDRTLEFVDVKGGQGATATSITKIKVCAEQNREFVFSVEKKLSKKQGGGWKRTEY